MSNDDIYEACVPILNDESLEDEDKTEKLEEFVSKEFSLAGKPLETAVLDVLWRFRNAGIPTSSPAITVRKSASPAPWQMSRSGTPTASPRSSAASPVPSSTSRNTKRPGLFRVRSSNTGSPFSSPRPSPSLLYAAPRSTQSPSPSPNPNPADFENSAAADWYGEYGNDNMDWLVSDDGASNASSGYLGGEFVPGADWNSSQMVEMSPYDILRSVLRDQRSDEEIEKVLEANGYDLSAAIASLMQGQSPESSNVALAGPAPEKTLFVGNKAMAPSSRPTTPGGQAKSSVVCRYWLQTGQCLRADCRFSHDLSSHVCKYWLQGNCLAGSSCIFSHDPSGLMNSLSINNPAGAETPLSELGPPSYEIQDFDSFPSLGPSQQAPTSDAVAISSGGFPSNFALAPEFVPSRPHSRPSSRQQSPGPSGTGLALDDGDAFPALGAATVRPSRKHHGKRGHGHSSREKEANSSNLLADVVRNAPNPAANSQSPRRTLRGRGNNSARENLAAVQAIPGPEHIPWLETGDRANKAYIKARQEAIKHGSARNKFLQSAAQAWHRQDVRAAKALSLRGQSENDLMREAHRQAADALYEQRNKHLQSASAASAPSTTQQETYIDLHGLHPAEAVSYLSNALSNQRAAYSRIMPRLTEAETALSKIKFLYAIVGTGHHSRGGGGGGSGSGGNSGSGPGAGGKDKIGRAIRSYLSECGYAFKEFTAPQEQGKTAGGPGGGILGIDVTTGDASREPTASMSSGADDVEDDGLAPATARTGSANTPGRRGKVRVLKAEEPDGEP